MNQLNAHALVIGVARYQQIPTLPQVDDAVDVGAALADPSCGGYEPANVTVVQEDNATRWRILDELEQLARRVDRDSTALVYFSGHGGQIPQGESFLMPFDSEWGTIEQLSTTAISSSVLREKLAAIPARKLTTILDCCHAAALAQPKDIVVGSLRPVLGEDALGRLATGKGRVVMAASRSDGSSYVLNGSRYGLFTEHLIAGLRGAAGGPDGVVRVLDLYSHAQRNVVARFPGQRPVLKAELEDNYPVAWHRGTKTMPTELAYDVLVVHAAGNDRVWAQSTLIRLLDEQGIRVCAEDLDAEFGKPRIAELERLVTASRFTVPVLTTSFSAGGFEDLQTMMAQHLGIEEGRARLVPIVREPCDARLGVRMLVHLDMTRDETVASGVQRLVRAVRKSASQPS